METKEVRFVPHGLNTPEVQTRLAESPQLLQARVDRINARMFPHFERLTKDITALQHSKRSADYCIPKFWALIDEVMTHNGNDVACHKGCSHCCHVQVLITQDEANVIGKRINRKPRYIRPPGRGKNDRDTFDWGYHNPCTFLVNGECSIYEHRPLPCRVQYNVDIDALLCELTPPETKPVPYLNPHPFLMAFLQMLGVPHVRPVLADIREFWPK